MQESLDKFTKELEKQVNDGVIKEGSNEWYSAMESISKMQESIFEATLKKYQDIIDNLSRISDNLLGHKYKNWQSAAKLRIGERSTTNG